MNTAPRLPILLCCSLALLVTVLFLMSGCERQPEAAVTDKINNVSIAKIDGCEYLKNEFVMTGGYGVVFTHKGNCNNPIHAK
jgi:hypothetical protein